MEATIRGIIGRAYWQLGLEDEADGQLNRAIKLRRDGTATDPNSSGRVWWIGRGCRSHFTRTSRR